MLLVLTPQHWAALNRLCHDHGIDATTAMVAGTLTVRDANDTMIRLMRRDRPDWSAFDRTVGTLIRHLASSYGRVHVYGEMVDLLAGAGEFESAAALEGIGTGLPNARTSPSSVATPPSILAIRAIARPSIGCASCLRVHAHPRDVLGSFLLGPPPAC